MGLSALWTRVVSDNACGLPYLIGWLVSLSQLIVPPAAEEILPSQDSAIVNDAEADSKIIAHSPGNSNASFISKISSA